MSGLSFTELRACLDCGKCTGSCPVAQASGGLSPRRIIRDSLAGDPARAAAAARACLTCRRCDRRCPAGIPYTDLVRRLRAEHGGPARPEGESHCGIFSLLSRIQAAPELAPKRLEWLTGDLETDPEGEYLLWVGCTPHFAAYFDRWADAILAGPRAAVKVLNRLGIRPAVSGKERCCGHDALWNGDRATFEKLARANLEWLAESPAGTILFYCPSCAQALRREVPELVGPVGKEMTTLSEFLAGRLGELDLPGAGERVVTWHDPCRLGRHAGVYEEPRRLLEAVPGLELREMARNRAGSQCCGGGNWAHCDGATRRFQDERLAEARATGAAELVTSCPRCLIHLRCAQEAAAAGNGGAVEPFRLVHLAGLLAEAAGETSDDKPSPSIEKVQ